MKLAAIYSVWDGTELLKGSMNCLKDHVDLFIIVYQDVSNFGEHYDPLPDMDLAGFNHLLVKFDPEIGNGFLNETKKRNLGLHAAQELACSHFLFVDCDEYYDDFGKGKELYQQSGKTGTVCKMYTYFNRPTWRFENPDNYYVPFIHRIDTGIVAGNYRSYPFYCDPTRKINTTDVIEIPFMMHHFSYVRSDINRKVRNSSAKRNIERSQILRDYNSPDLKPNFHVIDFRQKLIEVENIFGITV